MNAFSEVTAEGSDLLSAIDQWRPDSECVREGDKYLSWANRCYASAGLSDDQIGRRFGSFARAATEGGADIERWDAALALARHCAFCRMPADEIMRLLVRHSSEVPNWPDTDELAEIVQLAVREMAR